MYSKLILLLLICSLSLSSCYHSYNIESPAHVCSDNRISIKCQFNSMRIVILSSSFNFMNLDECAANVNYMPIDASDCDNDLNVQLIKECNGASNCNFTILNDQSLAKCGFKQTAYVKYLCIAKENFFAFCNQHITKEFGYIASPNYPGFYIFTINCTSTIKVETGQVINFEILDIDLKAPEIVKKKRFKTDKEEYRCTDKLILLNETQELAVLCNDGFKNRSFVFKSHPLTINFDIQDGFNHNRGFLARYTIDGCPHLKHLENGHIEQDEITAKLSCNPGYVFADTHKRFKTLTCKGFNWSLSINTCVLASEVIALVNNELNDFYESDNSVKESSISNIIILVIFIIIFLAFNILLVVILIKCRKKKNQRDLDINETTAPLTSLSNV